MHRRPRAGRSRLSSFLYLAFLVLIFPRFAGAQVVYQTPVEVQETDIFGFGARALGMGNALVGLGDDISALYFNPAGLAQLDHGELSTGLSHDIKDRTKNNVGCMRGAQH